MASKLVLTFAGANGSDTSMSYSYADPDVANSKIKALTEGIIANGSIFENVPLSAKAAKLVITSEKAFDLSE